MVTDNRAQGEGGGIYSGGSLDLRNNSRVDANSAAGSGGGIYSSAGITISSALVRSNESGDAGGGVFATGGSLSISNATIDGNASQSDGGGVVSEGVLDLTSSEITNNASGGNGGGVALRDAVGTINGSTLGGNAASLRGGGLYASNADWILDGGEITANTSVTDGGGIGMTGGSGALTDSTLSANESGGSGGGLFIDGGSLSLVNTLLTQNTAAGSGGALASRIGDITLTGSLVDANSARADGGGIDGDGGSISLDKTTVSGNSAAGSGGGIGSDGSDISLVDSTVSGNQAGAEGGGLFGSGASVDLLRSTIHSNNASRSGGGIWTDGDLLLVNSTVSGNSTAGSGGGIRVYDGTANLSNSTVAYNIADSDQDEDGAGGGVDVGKQTGAGLLLADSTIFAANQLGSGRPSDIALSGGSVSGSHNLVQDGATAGGLVDGDSANLVGSEALLFPLALRGGLTASHAPRLGSPAVDAGSNPLNLSTDQTGASRQRGDAVDIGSFESGGLPTLSAFEVSAGQFAQGDGIGFTAQASDDSSVVEVRFYRDGNGDGFAQESELLGAASYGGGGATFEMTGAETTALPFGVASFLAVGFDDEGFGSESLSVSAEVLFSLRAGADALPSAASTDDDALWTAVINEAGDPIVFDNSTGSAYHLGSLTGAPSAIDDVIMWVDTKDGLVYGAYPSAEGVILVWRASDGSWSAQNLTDDVDGVAGKSPVRSLTQMSSTSATGNVVIVAGMNSDGELVGFRQPGTQSDGVWDWSFVNMSEDLAAQGMETPAFGDLISYVTPWNAWTIAGIDANGDIQGVWVAPASFTTWRIDNLSDITGAPAISGQLTVTQTSWRAINLGGVDAGGRLVVTWWVPSFGGDWVTSDLTTAAGGELLIAGRATGFVTPWGAINYAGLNSEGEVTAYWWTPQTDRWNVTPLTERFGENVARPAGLLTSHVSGIGTMNLLGSTNQGSLSRLWWTPNDDGLWKLTDLTEGAVRV